MVAAPNPRNWVNQEFVTDAVLNGINGIRDAMRFLLDPPRCDLRQSVAQSIPNAAFTSLTFTTERTDNEATASYLSGVGMHDPAVSNTRVTVQTAGTYLITGGIGFAANGTGRRGLRVLVNGVTQVDNSQIIVPATASSGFGVSGRPVYQSLSVGDYVELQAYQDSTVALTTDATAVVASGFALRWIGP